MTASPRIALAGFLHETNTFSPYPTELAHFSRPDGSSGLQHGDTIRETLVGTNVGTAGALETLEHAGATVVPLIWCSATPSGIVTSNAFETISNTIIDQLRRAGPVDGVLLELHGAMVTEQYEDPELELVRRVRRVVGPDVAIGVTLDLHSNTSDDLVGSVECMEAYRTYPHVDIADTGRRAARVLYDIVVSGNRRKHATRRLDFLIPLPWQCSLVEPMRGIYAAVTDASSRHEETVCFTPGFPAADVPSCGPVVFGFGPSQDAIGAAVERLYSALRASESSFFGTIRSARDAVAFAIERAEGARPVIIADGEDNPGGGAPGDTTSILSELVSQRARQAIVGILCDSHAVSEAHLAGIGARLRLRLGGRTDGRPLEATYRVEALADGPVRATGPMLRGLTLNLGRFALLAVDDVRVVVGAYPIQAIDQSMFRHVGIEPADQWIIALKSVVHFRNDFEQLAQEIVMAAAGGLVPLDPRMQRFRRLPATMRLIPDRHRVASS